MIEAILEEDFDVLDAPDGRTAVEMSRAVPIDAVILDIVLPDMSGLAALAELRVARPELPVVIVTGVDRAATAVEALRLGAFDYVTKPFGNEALLEVVHQALRAEGRARQALPSDPHPSTVLLAGCSVEIAAGLGATLAPHIEVQSLSDLPSVQEIASHRTPSMFIFDEGNRGRDWIDHAALLLERFPSIPAVVLVDSARYVDIRFSVGDRCRLLQRPFALAMLLDLVDTALPTANSGRPWRDARTAQVMEVLSREYAAFNLRRLAACLSVSPSYLSRRFREQVGVTIRSYVSRVKVYAARHLLEHGAPKLDAVAQEVGFHDASHLSRLFVDVLGHRPGQHRLRSRGNPRPRKSRVAARD